MLRNLKFLFAAATIVAVATPSFAASPDRYSFQNQLGYARDSDFVFRQDGKLLGRDPDANIRFELMRDGYADEN